MNNSDVSELFKPNISFPLCPNGSVAAEINFKSQNLQF